MDGDSAMYVLSEAEAAGLPATPFSATWVNHDQDYVFLGWGEDFFLVRRWIAQSTTMTREEKRLCRHAPMGEYLPRRPPTRGIDFL
jgi:hypothetical protein